MRTFKPAHINATPDDLKGNDGVGRYIFLPGSDGRAETIATHFNNVVVKSHGRGHHLYLGTLKHKQKIIDVAAIASGMGCPSMEIILHELFHLGAKRFLRVGTAGSLQPDLVTIGDIVNVQAAVRDDRTTLDYAPKEVPAVASYDMVNAVCQAKNNIEILSPLHTGLVHCKSSFYAREFFVGPLGNVNKQYNDKLRACGVLATEMETSTLFIQSQIYNHQLQEQGFGKEFRVLCGAVLGIIAVPPALHATSHEALSTIEELIKLALHSIKLLATTADEKDKIKRAINFNYSIT